VWGGGTSPKWEATRHNCNLVMKIAPGDHSLVFEIMDKNNLVGACTCAFSSARAIVARGIHSY